MNQIPESPSGYNYTVYPSFPPKAENKDVSTNYSEEWDIWELNFFSLSPSSVLPAWKEKKERGKDC